MLVNYVSLFTEYLPQVEGSVRQTGALWDEVAEWDPRTGMSALIHHEARFRALLHEDQMVRDHALYMINVFKEKLEQARAHAANTSVSEPSNKTMQPTCEDARG